MDVALRWRRSPPFSPKESQPIGMHDVVAAQPPVAGHHVAHHEGLGVSHVQIAGRVREHVQHVATLGLTVVGGRERLVLVPEGLPALLRGRGVVRRTAAGAWLDRLRLSSLCLLGHCLNSVVSSSLCNHCLLPQNTFRPPVTGMKKPLWVPVARGAAAQNSARLRKEGGITVHGPQATATSGRRPARLRSARCGSGRDPSGDEPRPVRCLATGLPSVGVEGARATRTGVREQPVEFGLNGLLLSTQHRDQFRSV